MYRTGLMICLLFIVIAMYACKKKPQEEFTHEILLRMGTVVEITLPSKYKNEIKALDALIGQLSGTVTQDTLKISENAGRVQISQTTYELLKVEQEYFELSGGHFNSAIFTVSSLYGFPDKEKSEPDNETLTAAIQRAVGGRIELYEENSSFYASGNGLKIDLGAFAKGWIVDQAVQYLKNKGINDFLINAGGDLYASGIKNGRPWRLGIADPDKLAPYLDAVNLNNAGLATSGTYERYFITEDGRHISHIFDGKTGKTANTYISVSVIAETTELADLLSTVYYFTEPQEIPKMCEKYKTPVMTIDFDRIKRTYCGWEEHIY